MRVFCARIYLVLFVQSIKPWFVNIWVKVDYHWILLGNDFGKCQFLVHFWGYWDFSLSFHENSIILQCIIEINQVFCVCIFPIELNFVHWRHFLKRPFILTYNQNCSIVLFAATNRFEFTMKVCSIRLKCL